MQYNSNQKLVVGSGWWCDEVLPEWSLGDKITRSVKFFSLWHAHVVRSLSPTAIVVTDSASPVCPDRSIRDLVTWIRLDQNYGHALDLRLSKSPLKYCGFTRSVLLGAMYALACEADYAYVEQDCLLFGDEIFQYATDNSEAEIFLGQPMENAVGLNQTIASPMLQQSFMIVRRSGLERFISRLLMSKHQDGAVSPEEIMRLELAPFDLLAIPYGRSRPIDITASHFYVQHLSEQELNSLSHRLILRLI